MQKQNLTNTFAHLGDCVVDIYSDKKKKYLGGTAFNSAIVASSLGVKSSLFSAVGTDLAGSVYMKKGTEKGIDMTCVQVKQGMTSTILLDTADKENLQYSHWKLGVLADYILSREDQYKLKSMDIAKIALFTPMQKLFEQFVTLSLPQTLKVADFSGTSSYTQTLSALKKYSYGCDVLVKSTDTRDSESVQLLGELSKKQKKICILLLGDKGSVVFENGNNFTQHIVPTKVIDSNGAGDAYIAAFCSIYFSTKSISSAMLQATKRAADVVSNEGGSGIVFNEQ